jgi:hypothetical protein
MANNLKDDITLSFHPRFPDETRPETHGDIASQTTSIYVIEASYESSPLWSQVAFEVIHRFVGIWPQIVIQRWKYSVHSQDMGRWIASTYLAEVVDL